MASRLIRWLVGFVLAATLVICVPETARFKISMLRNVTKAVCNYLFMAENIDVTDHNPEIPSVRAILVSFSVSFASTYYRALCTAFPSGDTSSAWIRLRNGKHFGPIGVGLRPPDHATAHDPNFIGDTIAHVTNRNSSHQLLYCFVAPLLMIGNRLDCHYDWPDDH